MKLHLIWCFVIIFGHGFLVLQTKANKYKQNKSDLFPYKCTLDKSAESLFKENYSIIFIFIYSFKSFSKQ